MDIKGQNCVVIGGATGIGSGICQSLVNRGARVHLGDIDFAGAQALADQYPAGSITPFACDVTSADSLKEFEASVRKTGDISLVFINAGAAVLRPFLKSTIEDWQWLYNINTFGPVRALQAFLPGLIAQKQRSRVIITSSATALRPGAMGVMTLYASTKSSHLGLVYALREELAGTNVDLSVVFPSTVQSQLISKTEATRPGSIQIEGKSAHSSVRLSAEEAGEIILTSVEAGMSFICTHKSDAETVRALQDEIMAGFELAKG